MVKVKICGITNLSDGRAAVAAGADAVGFIFYRKSPRYVKPGQAARIARALPASVIKMGLFVDEAPAMIRGIYRRCGLTFAQLQGNESPSQISALGLPAIKVFRVRSRRDIVGANRYRACLYLFDGYDSKAAGGTGRSFDWSLLAANRPLAPFILVGGLRPGNVAAAVRAIRPFAVDVCSGVERAPGAKDARKIRSFIAAAKGAA